MPWWWVIPAALGGYYLYKELSEEEDPSVDSPRIDAEQQRALLPASDQEKREDRAAAPRTGTISGLPEWTQQIDPIGLGQFLRRHGPRLIPTDWSGQLARSSVPPLRPAARNRALQTANLLFFPIIAMAIYTGYCGCYTWRHRMRLDNDPLLISMLVAYMAAIYAHGFVNAEIFYATSIWPFLHIFLSTLLITAAYDLRRTANDGM